jgi:hypothetical protein
VAVRLFPTQRIQTSMPREWVISLILHFREIQILATCLVLAMIESSGARIVVGVCLFLGLIFARVFHAANMKNDPFAMSILQPPPFIQ